MNGACIRQITPQGLLYVDNEGAEQFIDFAECHRNIFAFRTSPDYWQRLKNVNNLSDRDFDQHVRQVMEWKEVGMRQPLSPPWDDGPYIEFHTHPRIRFSFASYELYEQVLKEIGGFGWATFDLS